MRLAWFALALLLSPAQAASTQQAVRGKLIAPGGQVGVWRDATAAAEAVKLIRAGIDPLLPRLRDQHTACVVPSGTRAAMVEAVAYGQFYDVVVLTGPQAGCRGFVFGIDFMGGE